MFTTLKRVCAGGLINIEHISINPGLAEEESCQVTVGTMSSDLFHMSAIVPGGETGRYSHFTGVLKSSAATSPLWLVPRLQRSSGSRQLIRCTKHLVSKIKRTTEIKKNVGGDGGGEGGGGEGRHKNEYVAVDD